MPEFDVPGHTQSWEPGQPGVLAKCNDRNIKEGSKNIKYGPMNPASDKVFDFLKEFLGEVAEVFPDKAVHLGGDEVNHDCW